MHYRSERFWNAAGLCALGAAPTLQGGVMAGVPEAFPLDVIPYEEFVRGDASTVTRLKKALYEGGIVGIRGILTYREKVRAFIEAARAFSMLPDVVKEHYAPNHALGETFLGYEKGKEKFRRPTGEWVVDTLKASYYGFVPDNQLNKWPTEVDLKGPFQALGVLMSETSAALMQQIGLFDPGVGIPLDGTPRRGVGRMLHYHKCLEGHEENPFWCGAHFDHGAFTALLPAFYFVDGEMVPEPTEAGLFVKSTADGVFRKVVADDPNVLLFQVGEFSQLATHDAIRATEHRVHKSTSSVIDRYTMACFFDPPIDAVIHSYSELTKDARYGGAAGDPCSFRQWQEASFKRYIVKEESESGD